MDFVIKIIKLIAYFASLVSFVLCFIFNNVYLTLGSALFLALLFMSFHELGHVVGTIIDGGKVTRFSVFSISIDENKKLSLDHRFTFNGSVSFIKKKSSALIYLSGIFASALTFAISLLGFIFFRGVLIHHLSLLITTTILLFSLLPIKGSDLYNSFRK